MRYLILTLLTISFLALAGCVDLEYRPQPKGSFMKKYAGYDPADLTSAPAAPEIKAPGHVTP